MKSSRKNGSTHWKTVVLVAVLIVGVVALCLFLGKLQRRTEFVSKPLLGYRCRFTRIAEWKLLQDDSNASNGRPEDYTFFAPPLSPMQQWIADRLYHEPTSTGNFPEMRQTLAVSVTTAKDITQDIQIRNGYPEPNLHGFGQILTERHLHIDGCPASISRVNITFAMIPFRGSIKRYEVAASNKPFGEWKGT
ncbi:MAG: hypothetical protein JWL77_6223 [Chthonomonadaceae bacterium]|nr:hypothetical protein [Chthonomonadaceae bacterium]